MIGIFESLDMMRSIKCKVNRLTYEPNHQFETNGGLNSACRGSTFFKTFNVSNLPQTERPESVLTQSITTMASIFVVASRDIAAIPFCRRALLEILPEGWEIHEDLGGTEKESVAPTGTTEGLDKATVKCGCGWILGCCLRS